jgi:hypothetical protein
MGAEFALAAVRKNNDTPPTEGLQEAQPQGMWNSLPFRRTVGRPSLPVLMLTAPTSAPSDPAACWGNPAAKCSLRGFLSLTDASRYTLGVKPIRDCLPAEMIALAVTIRRGHQLHGHRES